MASEYQVSTPEAVPLDYDLAGIGSRFLAALIDFIIMVAMLAVIAIGALGLALIGGQTLIDAALIFLLTAGNLVLWGYYIAFETMWEGQSPGKRRLGLRVLKTSGMPIGFIDAVVRNLVRIVDFLPAFYGIGVVVMFASPLPRRLGDFAADTIVVRERLALTLESIAPLPFRAEEGRTLSGESNWNLDALTTTDCDRIRSFLEIAPGIRPEHMRARFADQLAATTTATIGGTVSGGSEEFLIRVLALQQGNQGDDSASGQPASREELAWDLRALTPVHDQIVEEFLSRAPQLKDSARSNLAEDLANRIAGDIGAAKPQDPELFLKRVMALRRGGRRE